MSLPISIRESIGASAEPPANPGQRSVTEALYTLTRDLAELYAAQVDGRKARGLSLEHATSTGGVSVKPGSELVPADLLDRLDYVRCATSQRLGIGWEPVARPEAVPAFDWKSNALRGNGKWNAWGKAQVR